MLLEYQWENFWSEATVDVSKWKIPFPDFVFDWQVSSMELVQEIHQVLMDREDTCIRTCFSLQLDGVTLDNFAELKSIEGLKEGSVIKVVEGIEF